MVSVSGEDPIQFEMLCKEEDFVFFWARESVWPLVRDLKDLEETGIEMDKW